MNGLVLVKLGGSVITKKEATPPSANISAINRIAKEISVLKRPLVVVLGGGSYGHQAAHKFGFGDPTTPASRLIAGIPAIRHNMGLLSGEVEAQFNSEDVSAVVIPPFPLATLVDGQIDRFFLEPIRKTLDSGHTVITHGDVCYDSTRGAAILSGDTIIAHIAAQLNVESVFVGTNVDGVLDGNPNENPNAKVIPIINEKNKEKALGVAGPSNVIDVTGGMTKKILDLLSISKLGIDVVIFNLTVPSRLEYLLKGEEVPCTRIQA